MGNKVSTEGIQLAALEKPVACIDPKFCAQQMVTLVLKEKGFSFSGDDFSIKDPYTDQTYFKVNGKMISLRGKKTFLDVAKEPVFNIQKKLISWRMKQNVFKGDGDKEKATVICERFTWFKPKLTAKFTDINSGERCMLVCKANLMARKCVLYLDRGCKGKENYVIVGDIGSPIMNMANLIMDKQTYYLRIAPGMDMALMTAMVVAFDEKCHDKK
ncbi:tubby C-terminal-like domain-containing protein [Powellomyces hirtus]|nr:tubby C-terminal-like domain-containing protein [Powellomyces hirtus]